MTEEFEDACAVVWAAHRGAMEKKNGEVVSGRVFDYENELDDPCGIGYISFLCDDGEARDVYADEFKRLVEPRRGDES